MLGDSNDITLQSRLFCLGECFTRNHASLNLFLGNKSSVIAREVGLGFFQVASSTVTIVGVSFLQSIQYIVKYELNTFFPIQCLDGWFFFLVSMHLFEIQNSCLKSTCQIVHDDTKFFR